MPTKLYSLHIGVSYVDESHYGNSLIPLPCCETDAVIMHELTKKLNYDETQILINEQATIDNVKSAITRYSSILKTDDLLVIDITQLKN